MRSTLDKLLSRLHRDDVYLLHCDMWGFKKFASKCPDRVINCGVQEPNMVNIAAGLASQGKKVIIYGVAGFVIYKAYEQIKLNIKGWAENYGSIVFVNAGRNGCYSICGRGHLVNDDSMLMDALDIQLFDPPDRQQFVRAVAHGLRNPGVRFVRLGWDGAPWKE
jgi:transketolase